MNVKQLLHNFKVYDNNKGEQLIGVGDEFPLPEFDKTTYTVKGAGFLGEYETPVPGHFKPINTDIPFRVMDEEAFSLLSENINLTLRGTYQGLNTESNQNTFTPVRIVMKGTDKGLKGGKAKITEGTETSIPAELWYILIEIDGKSMLELDKFNSVYKVMGKDMLEEVHKYC